MPLIDNQEDKMSSEINILIGPSIVDGEIYRFISTNKESGLIETWNDDNQCWIELDQFENNIIPEDIAKGEIVDDERLQTLTEVRKDRYSLQVYNAKKHVNSSSLQALACFAEANRIEDEYKATSYHRNRECFLILFRGDMSLHRKIFEYILKEIGEDANEDKFNEFYHGIKQDINEKVNKIINGPLIVKKNKKIIQIIEELPQKTRRLEVFANNGFRQVKKEDDVSWYDIRDAEKISLTEFYDIVRPPIGVVHEGSS